MTETHEIESMIDDIKGVLDEVRYEATAGTVHGVEFKRALAMAALELDAALLDLRKAKLILVEE